MTTIKLRRGTAAQWASANPVLSDGEPGFATDSGVLKVGDGTATWEELPGYLDQEALTEQYDARYGPGGTSPVTVAALTSAISAANPLIIAHRGAGTTLAPQNTREAFRLGASYGFSCLEGGDLFPLAGCESDLAICHNDTVDSFTTSSGPVSGFSPMAWRNLTVDASAWFGGQYRDTSPITFDDICREFGGKAVLIPEVKATSTQGAARGARTLVRVVERYGLRDSVIAQSAWMDAIAEFRAAGLESMYLWNNIGSLDYAELRDLGVSWIGLSAAATADATILEAVGEGFLVVLYTLSRQWQRAYYEELGVHGYFSDSPVYFDGDPAAYRLTSGLFNGGDYYHGHVAPSGGDGTTDSFQRGTMVAPDGFRLATGSTGREILLGGISPLENDTPWQLDLAYDVTVESDGADRYVAVSFTPTDRPFLENNNRPSISVILRQNGVLAIFYRVGDGSGAVNAANKFVGTVATGHSVELRVVHQTDGTMAVSRLDDDATDSSPLTMSAAAGTDVAATDLYVHLGKTDNGSLSHDVLFHSPVITRP